MVLRELPFEARARLVGPGNDERHRRRIVHALTRDLAEGGHLVIVRQSELEVSVTET
jgi:hypothetical protein